MKKIRNVVLVLLLFLCFNRCEKNPAIEESGKRSDQFTVEQAEAWFGTEWTGAVSLKSGSIEKARIGIKPDWCNGFTSQNSEVDVVEVSLLVQGSFGFSDEASYDDWETTKNPKMINSLTRMIFLKYKKDGHIDQFLMTIVGNKEYHDKNDGRLSDNNYLTREKHFSGYLFYHDLTGNFVNGWKYEKGELVAKSTITSGDKLPVQLKMASTCITTTINSTYVQCTDWYSDSNYNQYLGTSCGIVYTATSISTECPSYFTGNGEFGTNYTTTNPGGYVPPPPPVQKKYEKILNHNYLSPAQTDLLEAALNNLINANCLSLIVYNSLVDNGFQINFQIKGDIAGYANYEPSNKTLSFKSESDINSTNLKEELFHAAQDGYYAGGTTQYKTTGRVNIEFEAKLFKDISLPYCCSCFALIGAPTDLVNEYNNWVQYTIQGNPAQLSNERYLYFLNKFNQYAPSEYKSQLNSNLSTPSYVKSIMSSCLN